MTAIAILLHHTLLHNFEKERHIYMSDKNILPIYPLICPITTFNKTFTEKEAKQYLENLKTILKNSTKEIKVGNISVSRQDQINWIYKPVEFSIQNNTDNNIKHEINPSSFYSFLNKSGFPYFKIGESQNQNMIYSSFLYGYQSDKMPETGLSSETNYESIKVFQIASIEFEKSKSKKSITWITNESIWIKL